MMFRLQAHNQRTANPREFEFPICAMASLRCLFRTGVTLSVIRKRLGHRSTETTKRYAHLADDYLQAESEKIGKLLVGAMGAKKLGD